MLILTRKPGDQIRINNDVTVTVLSVKGSQVRLGIDAPRHVDIHRVELEVNDEETSDQTEAIVSLEKKANRHTKKP